MDIRKSSASETGDPGLNPSGDSGHPMQDFQFKKNHLKNHETMRQKTIIVAYKQKHA